MAHDHRGPIVKYAYNVHFSENTLTIQIVALCLHLVEFSYLLPKRKKQLDK
jgi:hypothetical protein